MSSLALFALDPPSDDFDLDDLFDPADDRLEPAAGCSSSSCCCCCCCCCCRALLPDSSAPRAARGTTRPPGARWRRGPPPPSPCGGGRSSRCPAGLSATASAPVAGAAGLGGTAGGRRAPRGGVRGGDGGCGGGCCCCCGCCRRAGAGRPATAWRAAATAAAGPPRPRRRRRRLVVRERRRPRRRPRARSQGPRGRGGVRVRAAGPRARARGSPDRGGRRSRRPGPTTGRTRCGRRRRPRARARAQPDREWRCSRPPGWWPAAGEEARRRPRARGAQRASGGSGRGPGSRTCGGGPGSAAGSGGPRAAPRRRGRRSAPSTSGAWPAGPGSSSKTWRRRAELAGPGPGPGSKSAPRMRCGRPAGPDSSSCGAPRRPRARPARSRRRRRGRAFEREDLEARRGGGGAAGAALLLASARSVSHFARAAAIVAAAFLSFSALRAAFSLATRFGIRAPIATAIFAYSCSSSFFFALPSLSQPLVSFSGPPFTLASAFCVCVCKSLAEYAFCTASSASFTAFCKASATLCANASSRTSASRLASLQRSTTCLMRAVVVLGASFWYWRASSLSASLNSSNSCWIVDLCLPSPALSSASSPWPDWLKRVFFAGGEPPGTALWSRDALPRFPPRPLPASASPLPCPAGFALGERAGESLLFRFVPPLLAFLVCVPVPLAAGASRAPSSSGRRRQDCAAGEALAGTLARLAVLVVALCSRSGSGCLGLAASAGFCQWSSPVEEHGGDRIEGA